MLWRKVQKRDHGTIMYQVCMTVFFWKFGCSEARRKHSSGSFEVDSFLTVLAVWLSQRTLPDHMTGLSLGSLISASDHILQRTYAVLLINVVLQTKAKWHQRRRKNLSEIFCCQCAAVNLQQNRTSYQNMFQNSDISNLCLLIFTVTTCDTALRLLLALRFGDKGFIKQ